MKGLLIAIQFLTIIPIRSGFRNRDFSHATVFFPLVGLIIGSFLGLLYFLTAGFFTPLTAAAAVIIGELVLTSGLHTDGFMDTVDALASGKKREEALAVFKDTHTGSKSVIALVALLLGKFALLTELAMPLVYPVLLAMPVLGRWLQVWAMALFPYARNNGLGTGFVSGIGRRHLIIATLFTVVTVGLLLGVPGLGGMVAVGIISHWSSLILTVRLGGLVGDVYGTLCETGEVFFLLVMAFMVRIL